MPKPVVKINSDPETGTSAQETFQDAAIIGSFDSGSAPTAGFNTVVRTSDTADVATDFGDGSDIHVASQEVDRMGAEDWLNIALEATSTTEVLTGTDTSITDVGTASSVPIAGNHPVTVTVDGTDMTTVTDVTSSPPALEEGTLSADQALINRATGEVKVGTETSGAGNGIELTHSTLSWTDALQKLEAASADIVFLANTGVTRAHIGDLDTLTTWAGSERVTVVISYLNGQNFTTAEEGVDLATDVGSFINSPDTIALSHESPDDAAAQVVGDFAVHKPWYDPFFTEYPLSLPTGSNYDRLIGDPSTPGTFEGGSNGQGSSNVLAPDDEAGGGSVLLWNSLTTNGVDSDYRYIDVRRTETFLIYEARQAIKSLLKRAERVGFNRYGHGDIVAALNDRLQQYAAGEGMPVNYITPVVPESKELTQDTRANRLWDGIILRTQLSGNMHRAEIDLEITV